MNNKRVVTASIIVMLIGIFINLIVGLKPINNKQSTVDINYVTSKIENKTPYEEIKTKLDYAILNSDGNVLYRTNNNVATSINEAHQNYDTVVNKIVDGMTITIIFKNNQAIFFHQKVVTIVAITSCILALELICLISTYYYYKKRIIIPFKKMEKFATSIASGNLNAPLVMDKNNIFGAFTESFDIMRTKLYEAKKLEFELNESKKELVAELSHDIKTPISSIISTAELKSLTTKDESVIEALNLIATKANQINNLVGNLLNATLEELTKLSVETYEYDSDTLYDIIESCDLKKLVIIDTIPQCLIKYDKVRLIQVFENIISNSYKYANTPIHISFNISLNYLGIFIEDEGNTIKDEELYLLLNKYKRGSNTKGIEGSGLGLYISKELMLKMDGNIAISKGKRGFLVKIDISLA